MTRDPRPQLIAIADELSELMQTAAETFAAESHPAHAEAARLVMRADGLLRGTTAWADQLKAKGEPADIHDLELVLERATKVRDALVKLIEEGR